MTIQLFRDKDFPPCMSSIAPPCDEHKVREKFGDNIRWLRPRQIPLPPGKKPVLYSGRISPSQIEQRRLGDCWFVGALATICTLPEFQNLELTYIPVEGKVTMKIYKHGKWRFIEIDDLLPCDERGRLLFTSSTEPGVYWMSFIEKGYAKLHGSYFALNEGNPCDAMADLTGGIGTSVDLDFAKNEIGNLEDNRQYMELYIKLETFTSLGLAAICASTNNDKYGIITNHAYSVMSVLSVNKLDGSKLKMVLFRNPHGTGTKTWSGPYSKSDTSNWSNINPSERKKLLELLDKDGYIWTDYKTFCQLFDNLSICNLPGKLKYDLQVFSEWKGQVNSGCFPTSSNKAPYQPNIYLKIGASDKSRRLLISLSQRDPRLKIKEGETNAKCQAVGLVVMKYPEATVAMPGRIMKYDKNLVVAESETWNVSREILLEHIFEPGPALELCIIPSTYNPGVSDVFRIRCMSAIELTLKTAQSFEEYWERGSIEGYWDPSMKNTKKYPRFRVMIRSSNHDYDGKSIPLDILVYQREKEPQYIGIRMEGGEMPVLTNVPLANKRIIVKVAQAYDFSVPCYNPQNGKFIVDVCFPKQLAKMMQCRIQLGSVI